MNLNNLQVLTSLFMDLHWVSSLHGPPPLWSDSWNFSGPIPNGSSRGCYSLHSESELLYIGVAIDARINVRTTTYTKKAENGYPNLSRPYNPTTEWELKGLKTIQTIGFPDPQWYLASALEKYLINELKPRYNKLGK